MQSMNAIVISLCYAQTAVGAVYYTQYEAVGLLYGSTFFCLFLAELNRLYSTFLMYV